jgi:hypothetical protein
MKTLEIKSPFGGLFLRSFVYVVIFCLLMELLFRISPVTNNFTYGSYGTSHPQFDSQIVNIKQRFIQNGRIDCIFLGNSETSAAMDPTVVEQIYFEKTGRKIICQNFGVSGLTASAAWPVAQLLIKNFQPSVIIFGTNMFDYLPHIGDGAERSITSSPWVQYELGNFSIDGWLIDNLYSYRYYLGIYQYLFTDHYAKSALIDYTPYESDAEIGTNGHELSFSNFMDMTIEEQKDYYKSRIKSPDIDQKEIHALQNLLSLNSAQVKIVVVEMPVTPTLLSLRPKFKELYPEFLNLERLLTSNANSELWLTQETLQIPQNGWYDLQHLNEIGKIYFSTMIGNNLSTLPMVLD